MYLRTVRTLDMYEQLDGEYRATMNSLILPKLMRKRGVLICYEEYKLKVTAGSKTASRIISTGA